MAPVTMRVFQFADPARKVTRIHVTQAGVAPDLRGLEKHGGRRVRRVRHAVVLVKRGDMPREILRDAGEKRGHSPQFVLTVGSTGNQNGTALYEGVVVLFLAQVFGKDLSLAQQISVVLMSVLAGVGTAGVPGGSLPLLVIVLRSTGVPAEGIGIILGVDRLLDMSRTVLNVTGDLAIAACVASKEAQPSDYPERGS